MFPIFPPPSPHHLLLAIPGHVLTLGFSYRLFFLIGYVLTILLRYYCFKEVPNVSTPASFSQQNTLDDGVHEELPIVKLEADQQPHQEAPHQPSIYVNTIQEVTELENENFEESYTVGDDFDMNGLVPNEQTDDYEGSNIDAGFADTSKGRICIVNPKDWNFVELQS